MERKNKIIERQAKKIKLQEAQIDELCRDKKTSNGIIAQLMQQSRAKWVDAVNLYDRLVVDEGE